MAINPLLEENEPTRFAAITPEHVSPALDELLAAAQAALEKTVSAEVPASYQAVAAALDLPVERLRRVWGHVCHLQAVADTPALRAAQAENLPRVTEFFTGLAADERLYAKYRAIDAGLACNSDVSPLTLAQRKALDDALRDFVLGGAELQGAARERFAAIQERCAQLSKQFGDNVLDATDQFAWFVDEARLAGVPQDVRQAARDAAAQEGKAGAKLTLKMPCYLPVMQHAEDRSLRHGLYRAYATRASELGAPAQDNSPVLAELVQLRQEEAALLGHASYAHVSLVPKMAQSPEQVLGFVRDLAQRARPFAERELDELRRFAAAELGIPDLQAWDRPFAAEKLKQQQFAFSSEEVRPYFTLPRVLQGLFGLIESLFGVAVREVTVEVTVEVSGRSVSTASAASDSEARSSVGRAQAALSVWHDSVRLYELRRGGERVAGFYLDLQARAGKQGGAWMDSPRQRWRRPDGSLQLPLAHLVCNFAPPVGGRPALLSHDDVITLFHEFGHGLHHMLTQVEELAVSGIAGVEWDACELPSQFMENFCWEWEVLQKLTAHVDTGEPLPRALFERMHAARNFQSGLALVRGCEYGLFDMRLHHEPLQATRALALAQEVAAEVSPMPPAPFLRYPQSFSHLFDGSYAAGYYGYAWAEVLSADAYSAFEDAGVFDPRTGQRFRETVLETGGSRSALANFTAFRGREPQLDALLRHQGLI
jgi:oligopeptidase A